MLRSAIKAQKRAIKRKCKTAAVVTRVDKVEVLRMRAHLDQIREQLSKTTKRKERLQQQVHDFSLKACSNLTIVYIFIHSLGGDSDLGLLAYDIVRRCPLQVHTVIDGLCASAGTLLFLAGDQRSMAQNGTMMIHETQAINSTGTSANIKADLDNLIDATNKIINIYEEHGHMSRKRIIKEMKTDRAWTYQETLDRGFLSRVETPF
jgi:ATP-dependent protease ClpP protease subunit